MTNTSVCSNGHLQIWVMVGSLCRISLPLCLSWCTQCLRSWSGWHSCEWSTLVSIVVCVCVCVNLGTNTIGALKVFLAQMQSLLFPLIARKLLKGAPTDFLPILHIASERGITLRSPFFHFYIVRRSPYLLILISFWNTCQPFAMVISCQSS